MTVVYNRNRTEVICQVDLGKEWADYQLLIRTFKIALPEAIKNREQYLMELKDAPPQPIQELK